MCLAPTSPHPLGCPAPCHPLGVCSSRNSLSHGDRECVHWSQEFPGLLLQLSPHPPICLSSPDFRQPVAGDSAIPYPTSATQPPGQASSQDLPRRAEVRRCGWSNGCGERLPSYKPHPLIEAERRIHSARASRSGSLPPGGHLPEQRQERVAWAKGQVKVGLNLGQNSEDVPPLLEAIVSCQNR